MNDVAGSLGHYGRTVRFETERERQIFVDDIRRTNLMVSRFGSGHHAALFDSHQIDFAGEIKNLLVEKGFISATAARSTELGKVHELLPDSQKALDESELNKVSKAFYDTNDAFLNLYRRFVREAIGPLFGEDMYFQATPTLRFQFPKQPGFNWKPRIHTDVMLGHPPSEVNIWLPFTPAFGTNTMLIASLEDSVEVLDGLGYDFEALAWKVQKDDNFWQTCARRMHPVELKYGECLLFDPRCLHATQDNRTDATRVSMDVRIILRRDFEALPLDYRGTGRMRMRFAPGHYYHDRSIRELVVG